MKKQQILLVCGGFLLFILLFFFGNTIPPVKPATVAANTPHAEKKIETEKLLTHAKERLTPQQLEKVTSLENSVKRGDVKNQQLQVYKTLASFWEDSVRLFEPYAYYTAEAAKLENSEKSLTFAAHLFLTNLKTESDPPMQNWLATNAKVLFQKALEINPKNDSSKVGLGACYIFGNISDNPMEGISLIREVVQRDPNNLFGHLILGLGGVRSAQFDKAIEHFKVVVDRQPDNLEATLNLAETYDQKGDKEDAIKWYKVVKAKIPNPEAQKELDTRIKALQ
ncbi:tetratricopeptide repeat protein [Segetibacter sp.]|uniref:tetratricopeptide repeat protein n=1 Tax=Segetibacter sp. TaxID=2231182 RepID=UPI002611FE5B|nr:tetratricopeptide repeat protein [Segetibacter sp.]MCW3079984.1 tetratricopeptide repeat protein [Segetibacter sp.]